MIIDCISDLHGHYPELEGGDLLIVAGDLTAMDDFMSYQDFATWLARQKYRKKIFVSGNHDNFLYENRMLIMPLVAPQDLSNVEFLCDSGTEFEGLKIWGSPWTKWFHGVHPKCKAFMLHSEEELAKKFDLIPDDVDILVTHGPPYGIFDRAYILLERPDENIMYAHRNVGSASLYKRVLEVRPRLHCFGHIHESYEYRELGHTHFVNCAHVNERYEPVNKPIRVIL